MAFPLEPEVPQGPRILYLGRPRGTPLFSIEGQRGFIRREDAIQGLRYNFNAGYLTDARGRAVPFNALEIPNSGRTAAFVNLEASWTPLTGRLSAFTPEANQELVERLVLIKPDGSLEVVQTSYGAGRRYDQARSGGWWRAKTSEALGYNEDERPATRDLQAAVANRQILVKTWRTAR